MTGELPGVIDTSDQVHGTCGEIPEVMQSPGRNDCAAD